MSPWLSPKFAANCKKSGNPTVPVAVEIGGYHVRYSRIPDWCLFMYYDEIIVLDGIDADAEDFTLFNESIENLLN